MTERERLHVYVHAERTPEKPALQMAHGGVVRFGELEERSNRLAQMFRGLGLRAGDHIALLLENQARFLEVCWAAQRSGLFYTAVSTRLTASEAAYIVNDCQARVFITSMATDEEKEASLAALNHAAGFIRRELGARLRMRYTPQLSFFYDHSIERGARIEELLEEEAARMDVADDSSTLAGEDSKS